MKTQNTKSNKTLNINGELVKVQYNGSANLETVRNKQEIKKHDRRFGSYMFISYDCDFNVNINGKQYKAIRHSTQGCGGYHETFEYNDAIANSEKKLAELILTTEL